MDNGPVILRIHPNDTVAVALEALPAGRACRVGDLTVTTAAAIGAGHKIALVTIARGEPVIKYGQPIGHATEPIAPGQHVHTHNMATNLTGITEYAYEPFGPPEMLEVSGDVTFDGYVRPDGRVGIRNEIWIIPTVGCINGVAETLARQATQRYSGDGLDGFYALTHPLGCSQLGADHEQTQRLLAALVGHPNAGGVLVLGLGCENNNIPAFREVLGPTDPQRVVFLNAQDVADELAEGMRVLGQLAGRVGAMGREPVPVAKLCVGLKCGGSDGLSGVTANPLVGAVADRLGAMGAATILTEIPEVFGAEPLLLGRCATRDVFDRAVRVINDFKAYFASHGQPIDKNPSPGNLDGGITTLEEKSLGCIQKGGAGTIVGVLGYGEPVTRSGLHLLDGPGNDMVAVTNLTAAGAQVILFTTGRGTPLGAPAPTLKIATNSALARAKPHWIDFDAGVLLGGTTMDDVAAALVQLVLDTASGRLQAANERNGWRDIAIFTTGVTL
jgi:altronate hydrolase